MYGYWWSRDLEEFLSIAKGPPAFLEKIEEALGHENEEAILKRKRKALENSWPNRVRELESLICRQLYRVT